MGSIYYDSEHMLNDVPINQDEEVGKYVDRIRVAGDIPDGDIHWFDTINWYADGWPENPNVTACHALEYLIERIRYMTYNDNDDSEQTLFNRIYVTPDEIALEFITEYTEHEVVVWNAYSDRTATLTDISVVNQTGTGIEEVTLPKIIPKLYNEILTIIVYEDGPPTQDTDYLITVDGTVYTVDVTGIRVVGFVEEPDFAKNIQMVYSFLTSIARHPRYLKEQRRPLQRYPFRDISLTINTSNLTFQKQYNLMHYGKDKVFAVPIYTERMQSLLITAGSYSLTISTDITYFYNLLNNVEYVIIVDHTTGVSEVKEISSLVGNLLLFTSAISNTYNANGTVLYPCVFSYIKSARVVPETKGEGIIRVSFGEFKRTSGV